MKLYKYKCINNNSIEQKRWYKCDNFLKIFLETFMTI